MAISLQADSTLPQGYILVDGQRVASVSTTGGLSATLAPNTVTTSSLVSGSVTTEKIAPGAVVTADLADGAVTAAKMAGGQTGSAPVYGCRAWVNFNGLAILGTVNAPVGESITVTAGSDLGVFNVGTTFAPYSGLRYLITSIGGSAGATLGGVEVATTGIQILSANSGTQYRIRLLAGPALSNQTITGNNTSSGFVYNGTGIRESGNVSSVVKNSVGNYTINFTTPMPTANYTWISNAERGGSVGQRSAQTDTNVQPSPSSLRIVTNLQGSNTGEDMDFIRIAVFC